MLFIPWGWPPEIFYKYTPPSHISFLVSSCFSPLTDTIPPSLFEWYVFVSAGPLESNRFFDEEIDGVHPFSNEMNVPSFAVIIILLSWAKKWGHQIPASILHFQPIGRERMEYKVEIDSFFLLPLSSLTTQIEEGNQNKRKGWISGEDDTQIMWKVFEKELHPLCYPSLPLDSSVFVSPLFAFRPGLCH